MKKINILIAVMFVALISLIAFQWYWIQNAYSVKNEQFDRKVIDTLKETVHKIEKQEVIFLAKQKMLFEEKQRLINISKKSVKNRTHKNDNRVYVNTDKPQTNKDSLQTTEAYKSEPDILTFSGFQNGIHSDRLIILPNNNQQFFRDFLEEEFLTMEKFRKKSLEMANKQSNVNAFITFFDEELNKQFELRSKNSYEFYLNEKPKKNEKALDGQNFKENNGKPNINQAQKSKENKNTKPKEEIKVEQANLVKDVFTDLILAKRSIYERLGHIMLDTLLKTEFKNNGINLPFEYGVKDNGLVIFASMKPNHQQNPLDRAYKVRLFPNDTFEQEQFLHVYFPDKDDYIMHNMWSVFGSSFLLIFMVGGVFYYSVNTLLTQKKLSNIKNDFINNMTHELKTPVSTIALALEVIRDKTIEKTPEKTERYLNIIHDENKRLGVQVEKVLQIAQLEKGDITLKLEPLDINEILGKVVQNLSVQIEQKEVNLEINLNAINTEVLADQVHVTNIFFNLMDNAIKYSNESPNICISTEDTEDGVMVSIKDDGIGIPKDQQSKIFEKFYRVPKGNLHDVKGFGLGLSYVKNMIELLKGKIEVNSKIDSGSEFKVTLPNT